MSEYRLTHLKQLEAESIHIIREVAAEFENGRVATGTALDIDQSGALILKMDDGTIEKLFSGDVSIKPPPNDGMTAEK
jgi:biotin-(acetyl-CoA carboxylase) ligase